MSAESKDGGGAGAGVAEAPADYVFMVRKQKPGGLGGKWQKRSLVLDGERHTLQTRVGGGTGVLRKEFHVTHLTLEEAAPHPGGDRALRYTLWIRMAAGAHHREERDYLVAFATRTERTLFQEIFDNLNRQAMAAGDAPPPGQSLELTRERRGSMASAMVAQLSAAGAEAANKAKLLAYKAGDSAKMQYQIMKLSSDLQMTELFLRLRARGWAASVAVETKIGAVETAVQLEVDYTTMTIGQLPFIAEQYAEALREFELAKKKMRDDFNDKWGLNDQESDDEDDGNGDEPKSPNSGDGAGAEAVGSPSTGRSVGRSLTRRLSGGLSPRGAAADAAQSEGDDKQKEGLCGVLNKVGDKSMTLTTLALEGSVSGAFEFEIGIKNTSLALALRVEVCVSLSSIKQGLSSGLAGGLVDDTFTFVDKYISTRGVPPTPEGRQIQTAAIVRSLDELVNSPLASEPKVGRQRISKEARAADIMERKHLREARMDRLMAVADQTEEAADSSTTEIEEWTGRVQNHEAQDDERRADLIANPLPVKPRRRQQRRGRVRAH